MYVCARQHIYHYISVLEGTIIMHVLDNTLANVLSNTQQLRVTIKRVKFKQLSQHPKSVFQNTSFLTMKAIIFIMSNV